MNYETIVSVMLLVMLVSGLIACVVSLFTEYFVKKLFPELKTPTVNFIIVVTSIILTGIASMVYVTITDVYLLWYHYFAIFGLGILVSIICMNGYDKVLSYLYEWIKVLFNKESK